MTDDGSGMPRSIHQEPMTPVAVAARLYAELLLTAMAIDPAETSNQCIAAAGDVMEWMNEVGDHAPSLSDVTNLIEELRRSRPLVPGVILDGGDYDVRV